jgi:hypothetical protein
MMAFLTMAFFTMAFFTMAFFMMAFITMAFFTMAFSETHRLYLGSGGHCGVQSPRFYKAS